MLPVFLCFCKSIPLVLGCSEGLQTTALVATLMDVNTDMHTPCNSIMGYGEHCESPTGYRVEQEKF